MKALALFVKAVLSIYYGIVFPVRLIAQENIPDSGPFILCCNHISARDGVILRLKLKRVIHFMAKKELFANKLIGGVLAACGAFPVDRGKADLSAVRTSIKVLNEGGGLGIFPQGTRSAENQHTQMQGGTALIAQRTGAPVIPAYIDGPYRCFRRTDITFGHPVPLEQFARKTDGVTIARATDCIENAIWSIKQDR